MDTLTKEDIAMKGKIFRVYHEYEIANFICKIKKEKCVAQFLDEEKAKEFVKKYEDIHKDTDAPDRWFKEGLPIVGKLTIKEVPMEWQIDKKDMWWIDYEKGEN